MCKIKYMHKCLHIQGPNGNHSKMQSCILRSLTEEKCPWSQQALCWVRPRGIWPIQPAAPAVTLHVQELKYSIDAQGCEWGKGAWSAILMIVRGKKIWNKPSEWHKILSLFSRVEKKAVLIVGYCELLLDRAWCFLVSNGCLAEGTAQLWQNTY